MKITDIFEIQNDVAQEIAKALKGTFGTDIVWSKIMGDEIPHAHIWVYPNKYEATGDKKDFEGNAKKIIEQL